MTYNEFDSSLKARVFFGLSEQYWRVFSLLVFRPQVAHPTIFSAMWPNPDYEPDQPEKLIHLFACKTRKILKPFGVSIKTAWGTGYYMTKEDRAKAIELARKAMEQ